MKVEQTLVAKTRSLAGNQAALRVGPMDMAIGPARPLRNWPRWMRTVASGLCAVKQRTADPSATSMQHVPPAIRTPLASSQADGMKAIMKQIGPQFANSAMSL